MAKSPRIPKNQMLKVINENVDKILRSEFGLKLEEAKEKRETRKMGTAFTKWYLKGIFNKLYPNVIDITELEDIITDGTGDNQIDAIFSKDDNLFVFQSKFHDNVGTTDRSFFNSSFYN